MSEVKRFKLSDAFIKGYEAKKPPFGFNGLGELVFMRTYSRIKEDGANEKWFETIRRVVEGCYTIQKKWIKENHLFWDNSKAQKSAQEMYDRIFNMKFLPPGRGLWIMGTPIIEEKGLGAALNNCGFVSTKDIDKEPTKPFEFLMDMSMLGVGVGFDTKGAGKLVIQNPQGTHLWEIGDRREDWVESVRLLLSAYFSGTSLPRFDYSFIRKEGEPIKGFGGVSSGPQPLIELHQKLDEILKANIGKEISTTLIVDIMNLIGKAVVAGNVRRTAEIVFGDPFSDEYLDLKNYDINQHRAEYGWTSNNSVFAELGMDYGPVCKRVKLNGEPGFAWLENMQSYSRMDGIADHVDFRAAGGNPCQPESAELLTQNGIRLMRDINIGDKIWSEDGWVTVKNKWSTGIKPVFKYNTSAGYFVGTENHRIIENGIKVEVKDANSIDVLTGPLYHECDQSHKQAIVDGLIVGDGTVHLQSATKVYLIVGKNDQDYFSSNIADMFIEKHAANYENGWKVKTTIKPEELKHTYDRVVPERYFHGTQKDVANFLIGLYSANGSICGKRVTLKSTSPRMVEQVQLMLSSIGINSYVTTNKTHSVKFNNGVYTCKESYDLNIGGLENLNKFANIIGFLQNYKNQKLKDLIYSIGFNGRTKTTYEIKSIEYLGDEEVFDITVDGENHTYWTGGLNVSNCLEQTLEHMELCNLVETFPANHDNLDDFKRTLKFAYLYAKTVTLIKTHWHETNAVMLRNRRIGASMSGIAQFIHRKGIHSLKEWCEEGYNTIEYYDEIYSEWFAVPKSIKKTSIKPSGTVSLVAGATPGEHYPESRYYIRRMRIAKTSNLLQPLLDAGFYVEPAFGSEDSTLVVEIPVDMGENIRTLEEVSMWEQLSLTAFLQKYWADNQVSATITFKPETEGDQIEFALNYFQYQLKGISFLPRKKDVYPQMPYEAITKEKFNELNSKLKPLNFDNLSGVKAEGERFCSNDVCTF